MKGGPCTKRRQRHSEGTLWYDGATPGPVIVRRATAEELQRVRDLPAPTKVETVYTWEGRGRNRRPRLRLVENGDRG